MKINKIVLNNFGSYEGETVFDTEERGSRNIVLIGGKNGAGKTTLFTAMRVCLYGYRSMGYKNKNSFYIRAITKLINNKAKMTKPAESYVSLNISISNGQSLDRYVLNRRWLLNDTVTEIFTVEKNGLCLDELEIADFEKFLLTLIPPELFNLYFFDGEKIVDFFLNEGSNNRIKDAFLTLCGYDTFDIMRKNFKRISSVNGCSSPALDEYIAAKDDLSKKEAEYRDLDIQLNACFDHIANCEADLASLEKDYYQKGGVTEEEWNKKLQILKDEEKKREGINTLIKKWANDIIPFIIIRDKIEALKSQISNEQINIKYKNFCEIIEDNKIRELLSNNLSEIKKLAKEIYGGNDNAILSLSFEDSALLIAQINEILNFEESTVLNAKKDIKKSVAKSARIRKEIDNSSVTFVKDYMDKRAQLLEDKAELLKREVELEREKNSANEAFLDAQLCLAHIQSKLEEEIKKESINDISSRAIIMLDKLQDSLYKKQIKKVETFFRREIGMLMRKKHFIDDIMIDDQFNTHIYKTESMDVKVLLESFETNPEDQLSAMLGEKAMTRLEILSKDDGFDDVKTYLKQCGRESITLKIEIDKMALSSGEKQIFIMCLYHSLISLCKHEIPFIIDTPFARIDTLHRLNISKYFFSNLKGQLFILSTDKEIDSEHVKILKDKITSTYMLENIDNKKTIVKKNIYFEV